MNTITINVDGLDEGIRCALCTNSMKTERGCDGSCSYNKNLFENIMDVIQNSIVENAPMVETRPKGKWITRWYFRQSSGCYDLEMKVCSECRDECSWDAETGISEYNFCPNCGADMRGEANE